MGQLMEATLRDEAEKKKLVWKAREWVMFCAKTIEAQAPAFWRELVESIEELIEQYNLSSVVSLHRVPSSRFVLRKPTYPAVELLAELNLTGREINYVVARTPSRRQPTSKVERRLHFSLDEAGELYLRDGESLLNVQTSAELFLQPFPKEH